MKRAAELNKSCSQAHMVIPAWRAVIPQGQANEDLSIGQN